ncbi:sodium:calcium antiporter [Candidatus Bathyarchaeota archaeon A05DMB-2]|nr:sodium:calcium antiporter [Candidatus Bathyarchaeota archaeon A05DMB-2]
MFEDLGLLGNALILIAALVILYKASDLTITHSINVASVTGLGKTTVGFILVAFSTSLPELFVAFFSVLNPEDVGVSIGNVLGANIVNVCFILGICFVLVASRGPAKSRVLPKMAQSEMESLYFGLFIASIVPLALIYLGHASRFIGAFLLFIFVFYMYQLSKAKTPKEQPTSEAEKQQLRKYVILTFVGAAGIVACAFLIVESASYIASSAGIPTVIIGATIVAFGTTIPELATSVGAVNRGHMDMALGNIVGSGFVNITCILGVTLISSPLSINVGAFSNVAIFALMANLLLWYFLSNERAGRREGAILLFMYALFLAISFGAIQVTSPTSTT